MQTEVENDMNKLRCGVRKARLVYRKPTSRAGVPGRCWKVPQYDMRPNIGAPPDVNTTIVQL